MINLTLIQKYDPKIIEIVGNNIKRGGSPRGFGLTVNRCSVKELLVIGH